MRGRVARDAVAVLVVTGAALALFIWAEGFEVVQQLLVRSELGEADEVFLAVFVFAAAAVWFAWRRLEDSHRTVETLQGLAKRIEQAASSANIVVWNVELKDLALATWPPVSQLLGFSAGELPSSLEGLPNAVVHPDDLPALRKSFMAYVGRRNEAEAGTLPDYQIEFRARDKSGAYRWFLGRGRLLRQGTRWSLVGCHIDISEQKRYEASLLASEARLRAFLDNAADAVFVHDLDGRIVEANSVAAENLGYARSELLRMTIADFAEIDPPAAVLEQLARLHRGERLTVQTMHRRKDGTTFPVEVRVALVGRDGEAQILGLARDTSERMRAEERLRRSEQRWFTLFDSAPDPIYVVDHQGRVRNANFATTALLGAGRGQVLGSRFEDVGGLEGEQAQTWREILAQVLGGDSPEPRELWLHPGGEAPLPVEVHAFPLELDGAPCVLSVARDIRLRKAAERALSEANERFQRAVRGSNIALWEYDLRTGQGRGEDMATRLLGYPLGEISADWTHWLMEFHPDDVERVRARLRACTVDPNARYEVEFRARHRDGGYRWFLSRAVRGPDEQGLPNRLLGTMIDITERKGMDEALAEREARYRDLFEEASDCLYTHDLVGNFTSVNKVMERVLGYRREELLRMNVTELIAPEHLQLTHDTVPGEYQMDFITKDGRRVPMEVRSHLLFERGEPVAWHGTMRDVTLRKQAEDALRRAKEEAESASRAKSEFLALMSHELRAPLNAVLGLSEALREEVYGQLNEKQHRSLELIAESGRDLLGLINDILDMSKIEAGRMVLNLTDVPAAALCEASLRLVRQAAAHKQLSVHLTADPAVQNVHGDAQRLKQVLVNLLSNAVKFTPVGGAIGLEVTGDSARQTATFTVWDTGVGIAADDLPRLFQPFVQLDARLARRERGSGLGLTLVRHLVELHGGTLSVSSEAGHGSRFAVTLAQASDRAGADAEGDQRARLVAASGVHDSAGTVSAAASPVPRSEWWDDRDEEGDRG